MGTYYYGFYDGLGNLKTLITVNQLQSRGATGVSCFTQSQMFAIQRFIHQKTCIMYKQYIFLCLAL
jgi:hypothetical protein